MTKNLEVSKKEIPNRTEALLDNYKSKDKIEETRLDAKAVEGNKDLLDRLPSPTEDTIQMTTVCAYVLKVGDQAYKDESKFPNGPWCKKGDWIIFGRYAGSRFKIEGGEVRILNDDEIIAKINNPEDILHAY